MAKCKLLELVYLLLDMVWLGVWLLEDWLLDTLSLDNEWLLGVWLLEDWLLDTLS